VDGDQPRAGRSATSHLNLAPLGADGCRIDFALSYDFERTPMARLARPVFDRIANAGGPFVAPLRTPSAAAMKRAPTTHRSAARNRRHAARDPAPAAVPGAASPDTDPSVTP
jgi:hypothetical protein